MDYYFIKKHADMQASYCCPFLKCRIPFDSAVGMVEHIKTCSKFRESEMWCPACDVWGTYHTSKSGSCSWKKHTFAEKMLKPIKSISGHIGYKASGRRSPSPSISGPSKSPSLSISTAIEIARKSPTCDVGLPNGIPAEIDSRCEFIELYDDSIFKGKPAEMEDGSSNTSFISEMANSDRLTTSEQAFASNSLSRTIPRDTSIAPPVPLSGIPTSCHPPVYNENWSPYATQQTSRTLSNLSTYQTSAHSGISPTSTMCEGRIAPVNLPGSSQPVYKSTFTESPVTEDLGASSLAPTNANIGLDLDLSMPICQEPYNWSGSFHHVETSKSPETVSPEQRFTDTFSGDLSLLAPNSLVRASLNTHRRASYTNEQAPETCSQNIGYYMPGISRSSPPRSLPVGSELIGCEFHDCRYTYKGSEMHKYSKHRIRNHRTEEIFRCEFPGCTRSYKNRKDNLKKHQRLAHHIISIGQVLGVKSDSGVKSRKTPKSPTKRTGNNSTPRPYG